MASGWCAGLVSRQQAARRANQLADALRSRILTLLAEQYEDFGPTLAAEKLLELDGITVSRETIRQLQIGARLWKPKRQARRVFQTRERRPRLGELVQIDGSPHAWFEGRGPRCTLIRIHRRPTSRLTRRRRGHIWRHCGGVIRRMAGRWLFTPTGTAFSGSQRQRAESGDGKTEIGRVVERLDIALIQASTPRAEGVSSVQTNVTGPSG